MAERVGGQPRQGWIPAVGSAAAQNIALLFADSSGTGCITSQCSTNFPSTAMRPRQRYSTAIC
jgi:hypothetical protein